MGGGFFLLYDFALTHSTNISFVCTLAQALHWAENRQRDDLCLDPRGTSKYHGSLRLTLSPENTEEEVDYIIQAVTDVVAYLRGISPVWHELEQGKRDYILK